MSKKIEIVFLALIITLIILILHDAWDSLSDLAKGLIIVTAFLSIGIQKVASVEDTWTFILLVGVFETLTITVTTYNPELKPFIIMVPYSAVCYRLYMKSGYQLKRVELKIWLALFTLASLVMVMLYGFGPMVKIGILFMSAHRTWYYLRN